MLSNLHYTATHSYFKRHWLLRGATTAVAWGVAPAVVVVFAAGFYSETLSDGLAPAAARTTGPVAWDVSSQDAGSGR